jgi:hypothetical protein
MPFDPHIIEAKLALRQIPAEEMVELACEAIEAGHDSPAVLRMAALIQPSGYEVDQHLTAFMRDAHLQAISIPEASVRLSFNLANEILQSNRDPLPHVKQFLRWWIDADHPVEIQELGVLDDEVDMLEYLGYSEKHIREAITKIIQDFVTEHLDSGS